MARPLKNNLVGQKYGRLTVVEKAPSRNNKVYWHCVCECGNETDVQTFNLIFGLTKSCGCYRKERNILCHNRKI